MIERHPNEVWVVRLHKSPETVYNAEEPGIGLYVTNDPYYVNSLVIDLNIEPDVDDPLLNVIGNINYPKDGELYEDDFLTQLQKHGYDFKSSEDVVEFIEVKYPHRNLLSIGKFKPVSFKKWCKQEITL